MLRRALQRLAQRPQQQAASTLLRSVEQMPISQSIGVINMPCSPILHQQQLQLGFFTSMRSSHQQLACNWNNPQLQHASSAAYSTLSPANASSQLQQQQNTQEQQQARPYFWNGLSSKIHSRKPAIKRPARHQWHYCNPEYDPMAPLPKQPLPPYAPARAHEKDYRKIYFAGKPLHNRKRYKRMWQKNMAIADQRWRQAWEARLAAKRKAEAKLQRLTERIIRQRSWEAWKADQAAAAQQ